MDTDPVIQSLPILPILATNEVGHRLHKAGLILVTAESCTGGLVAAAITSVAGSSRWFERGFVTYSNQSKIEMLGVRAELIHQFGAVSEPVARAMAEGALQHSDAQLALAVTGIAGPAGGTQSNPVGTVCFAWNYRAAVAQNRSESETRCFKGDRQQIRLQAVKRALAGILEMRILDKS